MAHFCKIDESNEVKEIHVVANTDCLDENGNESEAVGVAFLTKMSGHPLWKQCSYNTNFTHNADGTVTSIHTLGGTPFRGCYPGKGWFYNAEHDFFHPPKPYPSWTLNTSAQVWEAPVTYPSNRVCVSAEDPNDNIEYRVEWDEANTRWTAKDKENPPGNFIWNPVTSNWDSA